MLHRTNFTQSWRLINYRRVNDLVTAEFLHDLYNRHRPEINSIRFRNTVCIYHGTDFRSYAPTQEWDRLARVLGYQFFHQDPDLLGEVQQYLVYPKPRLTKLFTLLENQKLPEDGEALAQILLKLHYTALGEICGVNLVQLEHALAWAIRRHVESFVSAKEADQLLPFLVKTEEQTVAVQEEIAALTLSIEVSSNALSLTEAVEKYKVHFGNVQNSYGAVGNEHMAEDRLQKLCTSPVDERRVRVVALQASEEAPTEIQTIKAKLGIAALCQMAADVGMLRDRLKAMMGRVAHEREKLLRHAVILTGVSRNELSRYLLSELYDLLADQVQLNPETTARRWDPLVLQRQERLWEDQGVEPLIQTIKGHPIVASTGAITGLCASPGRVIGIVKQVRTRLDAAEVTPDHILVAFGTDFDLMEGLCQCAGIVTEEGGLLSHASVIARELGKPCLIGVQKAMSRLLEGTRIELNATGGYIKELELPMLSDHESLVLPLDAVEHWEEVGYKAYRIAQLHRLGYATLPGVVLPVGFSSQVVSEKIASHILLLLKKQNIHADQLIVRSSSTYEDSNLKSAAGIFISAVADSDPISLSLSLQKVLKAGESAQVKAYFPTHTTVPLAVLIQPYMPQAWGGVAFSRHPIDGQPIVLVEASPQGAHAVVNGQAQLRFEAPHASLTYPLGPAPTNAEELKRYVARIAYQLEVDLAQPVDIEWGWENGQFYIFQARPITTIRD